LPTILRAQRDLGRTFGASWPSCKQWKTFSPSKYEGVHNRNLRSFSESSHESLSG
jgi:hypothetical protein